MLQVFTDPVYTRNVWIVAPSYMLAFRIFEDSGFGRKLRAVPEDDEGIDIEFLKREIKRSEGRARSEDNDTPVSLVPLSYEAISRCSPMQSDALFLCNHYQPPPLELTSYLVLVTACPTFLFESRCSHKRTLCLSSPQSPQ
jgi:hypothetical protein